MEEILKDILSELQSIRRIMTTKDAPDFHSAQVILNKNGFHVTAVDGQEFTYDHGATLQIPYSREGVEALKVKCRSFNPKEKFEKFPVHYEFDTDTKHWKIFCDDKKIMKEILNYVQRNLEGKIVEKTV